MDSRLQENLADPLSRFMHQYKSLQSRQHVLNQRRVDKDRFLRQKHKLQEKDKHGNLPTVEAEYERAADGYASLNTELHEDYPALHEDRHLFFEPLLAEVQLSINL